MAARWIKAKTLNERIDDRYIFFDILTSEGDRY